MAMRGIQEPAWFDASDKQRRTRRLCRRPPCRFCMAWMAFSLLLIFTYKMSLPKLPPSTRFIGYQAFGILKTQAAIDKVASSHEDLASSTGQIPTSNDPDGPSYPLNVYAPLLPNNVPLTEITVLPCFPLLLLNCKPISTPEKDARLGPWVRVTPPLDPDTAQSRSQETDSLLGNSMFGSIFNQLVGSFEAKYLFYRRSRRLDVPRVVDLKLVETGVDKKPIGGDFAGWHRVKTDLRSSFFHIMEYSASMHLYYRTVGGTDQDRIGSHAAPPTDLVSSVEQDSQDAITELDVTVSNSEDRNIPS